MIAGICFTGICAAVYAGFFFTDPYMSRAARAFMWIARFGIPPLVVGVLYLAHCVRVGRIRITNVLLMIGTAVLVLVLFFPVADHFYRRSLQSRLDGYHPYLQLNPPEYHERDTNLQTAPIRVFCIGGSTTQFHDGSGRDWPTRVEEILQNAVTNRPIEVHNMGRQWYTTLHSLVNFEVNLRQHRPDIIIIMHGVNDLMHNVDFSRFSFGSFREDYGHFYGPVSRIVDRQSVLQLFLREARSTWYRMPRQVIETSDFPGLAPFIRNLKTLVSLARMDGATVVLMTQPYLYKERMPLAEHNLLRMLHNGATGKHKEWSTGTAARGMKSYNDAVRRLAQTENTVLIDLAQHIPKTLEYFSDDVHYRPGTFDLIAEHMAGGMEPLLKALTPRDLEVSAVNLEDGE